MISVFAEGMPADFPTGTRTRAHDGHVTEITITKILCSIPVRHSRQAIRLERASVPWIEGVTTKHLPTILIRLGLHKKGHSIIKKCTRRRKLFGRHQTTRDFVPIPCFIFEFLFQINTFDFFLLPRSPATVVSTCRRSAFVRSGFRYYIAERISSFETFFGLKILFFCFLL